MSLHETASAPCRAARWVALCALILAAGCEPLTRPPPSKPAEAPPATLLDAGTLTLAPDCTVPAGQPYRVRYVVGTDGRTSSPESIGPPDAPPCLAQAFRDWIATFRFAPLPAAEPLTTDWMLVTARRGS